VASSSSKSKQAKSSGSKGMDTKTAIVVKSATMFRVQLVCSVLSQRALVMTNIREDSERPGLTEAEIAFAKMLAEVTNGTRLSINETATRLSFQPGVPKGGAHTITVEPSINMSWIIEGVLPLAPFCKDPLQLTLVGGITDSDEEVGINLLRAVSIRLLEKFGVYGAAIDCTQRGFPPNGGGAVTFSCPVIRKHLMVPSEFDNCELKALRIRGLAQSSRVNPQLANRVATKARSILEEIAADVFINTDCRSNRTKDAGNSPGYGLTLWCELVDPKLAETTHADTLPIASVVGTSGVYVDEKDSPEALATRVAHDLVKELKQRGSVDHFHQSLIILLMANCPEEVVRANIGLVLSEHAVGTLRVVHQFLGVQFNITPSKEHHGCILISCVGNGVGNFARKVT